MNLEKNLISIKEVSKTELLKREVSKTELFKPEESKTDFSKIDYSLIKFDKEQISKIIDSTTFLKPVDKEAINKYIYANYQQQLASNNYYTQTTEPFENSEPSQSFDQCSSDYVFGDLNGDGVVDEQDMNLLLGQFGSIGSGLISDLDSDGLVTVQDMMLLISLYGQTAATQNLAPVAVDDSFTIIEDQSNGFIEVLANDYDPDCDYISVQSLDWLTINGAAVDAANIWQYINVFSGNNIWFNTDSVDIANCEDANIQFGYTITDGNGETDSATVSLTIQSELGEGLVIVGTNDDNNLVGSDCNDTISGGWGNDTIYGGDGNDNIGGAAWNNSSGGDDIIYGGDGNDTIYDNSNHSGAGGNDIIFGGAGNDIIYGTATIYGDEGNDYIHTYSNTNNNIYGGDGNDTILSNGGADYVDGGAGDDYILGGKFGNISGDVADIMFGGSGNDIIFGFNGADTIDGGDGNDIISGSAFSTLQVEFEGEGGNDFITGGSGADVFIFRSNELAGSVDTITDFEQGTDLISLRNGLGNIDSIYDNFNFDNITLAYVENDTIIIGYNEAKMLVQNVYLTSADFSPGDVM